MCVQEEENMELKYEGLTIMTIICLNMYENDSHGYA